MKIPSPTPSSPSSPPRFPDRLLGIYVLLGAVWILGADWIIAAIAPDSVSPIHLQNLKSWLLLLVSAWIFHRLLPRFSAPEVVAQPQVEAEAVLQKTKQALHETQQFQLLTLHKISQTTLCTGSLNLALQDIVEEVSGATGYPIIAIERYDKARQVMVFEGVKGIPLPTTGKPLEVPVDQTASGTVAHTGQPLIKTYAAQEPKKCDSNETLSNLGIRTFVCVPLTINQDTIGTLSLAHPEVVQPDSNFLQWITSLANYLALLIDHKRSETALQNSEVRFRQVAENIHEVFWMSSIDKNELLYISPAYEEIWGRTCESLYQNPRSFLDAIHPDDQERILAKLPQQKQGGYSQEYRIVQPNGSIRWIWDQAFPVRDDEGQVYRIVGVAQDITERKQAEAALQRSETRYRIVVEDQTELIGRFLPDTTVLFVNEAYCRFFELNREEVIGKSYAPLIVEEDRDRVAQLINSLTQENPFITFEDRVFARGEIRCLQWNCRAFFGQNGEYLEFQAVGRDVTELKRAITALQESEMRFQAFMNHSPASAWISDAEGRMIYLSQTYFRMFQFPQEDAVGKTVFDLYPTEIAQQFLNNMRTVVETNQVLELIEVAPRPDGTLGDFLVYKFPIPGLPEKHLVGGVAIDITDRTRAELALRESEAFLKLALDFTNIGSWDWHLDTNEVIWNENHARLLGLVPSEIEPSYQLWRDRVHPDDLDRVEQTTRRALETQTNFEAEYRVIYPDGSLHWLIGRARGVYDDSGRAVRMIGVILDITDRKQAEQEIQLLNQTLEYHNLELETLVEQRTAELSTLINTLPDYIFVIDRKQMKFLFCNDRNAEFIGVTNRQQVEGKTLFECFPPEMATNFAAENQQVFESGEPIHFQASYPTPRGTLHVDTYKIPLKLPNGETYALIGASRDITELVKTRQQIADRTIQLEAANRELESFSYSVSHDLRAPLRHVNGFVVALTDQLCQNGHLSDPKVQRYLQIIQDSSQKMGQLIDGLLTLSRLGRRQMVDVPVNLSQLVETSLTQLTEGVTPDNASKIASDRQPTEFVVGSLPVAMGDATLLQQVFVNLLDNAIKFSRDSNPARIEVGALSDGTIFVRDNGVGFQMEYADQLFGAFQRLHSQAEFEGTGIGLAIVQRIIHRHGGSIWAESQPGQGTTFFFKISNRREDSGHP
ncbi:PAS domain S-box protein [Kovacikia minuta CCNUW1]|uniref:PAS domain S-box protein n=1 Tax=Kovacikia minuta TaxID=2931930 RepID=UPI001CCB85FA|nr:PAS domain S-box protein [Kovacikia minuta]UBF24808.1 PAS domain S-box protein [Kovacikia minuta CCNUW1]